MGAVGGVAILGGNFEAATFPEDKVVQRSLTAGTLESSPIDAIILDALPLGAPGQLDSHAFIWKGHSNNGSPHTIDWKAFVNVTADDGTGSLWTLQTRIDGAPYTDILTVDDNGLLTVSGATFTMDQLIIDSDNTEAVIVRKDGDAGDVFIVDTVNDVVRLASNATFLTFGASSDARLERVGPRILRMREPGAGGVALGAGGENTLQLYARDDGAARFLELTGDGPIALVKANRLVGGGQFDLFIDVSVGRIAFFNEGVQRWNIQGSVTADFEFAPFITDRYDLGSASFAVRNLYTNGVLIGQDKTSAYDAITIDGTDLTGDGQQDSGAIIWTGLGFETATPHDIDWKAFVDVTADDGTGSIFTLQTRIDAGGFATVFQIDDVGNLTIPGSFTVDGLIIDVDSDEAFLVRKNSDGGDVFTVDTNNSLVIVEGTAQSPNTNAWALLNETASRTNPTLIPRRSGTTDFVTGIGGIGDGEFSMIVNSVERARFDTTRLFLFGDLLVSGGQIRNSGNGKDQIQLAISGSTSPAQTLNIVEIQSISPLGNAFVVDAAGNTLLGTGVGFTTPQDILVLDTPALVGDGQRDSHAILWTGKGFETATPHDIDWKAFVNVTADDGTGSIWTLQARIDGASFVDEFTILATTSPTLVSIGPGSTGGALAFGPSASAAQAGTVRFQFTDDIRYRNEGDDGDFIALSFGESSKMILGEAGIPFIEVPAQFIVNNEVGINVDNAAALSVRSLTRTIFRVDTINNDVELLTNLERLASVVDRFKILGRDLTVNSSVGFSGAILLEGQAREAGGSLHDATWRMFVEPLTTTAFDGQSVFKITAEIDTGGPTTVFTLTDTGDLIVPGSFTIDGLIIDVSSPEAFLVRKDGDSGDVFVIDTDDNEVKIFGTLLVDVSSTTAFRVNDGGGGNVFNISSDNGALITITGDLLVLEGPIRMGSSPPLIGSGIGFSNADAITWRNANDNGDLAVLSSPQSDEFDMFNTGTPRVTFKQVRSTFEKIVQVHTVGTSTSAFTVGGTLVVDTVTNNVRAQGTLQVGASSAVTGTIRLPNSGDIVWRNAANNGDNILLSVGASDEMILGESTTGPFIRVVPELRCFDRLTVTHDSTNAFRVLGSGLSPLVFTVDTTNEAVRLNTDDTFLAFGASSDAQIHRGDGADILEQRRGANSQKWNIYDNFVSNSDYDRLGIYIGGGPPVISAIIRPESTDATQGINLLVESLANAFGDGSLTLKAGTGGATFVLNTSASGGFLNYTGGEFQVNTTSGFRLQGLILSVGGSIGTAGIGMKIDIAGQGAAAFEDSHSIDLIGAGQNANRATWRTFVDVLDINANSIWTLQNDQNGGGFNDVLTIEDGGLLALPQATSALTVGAIPASAGAIRLSTQTAIEWRNAGNTNNLTVLTTDGSDVLFFGDNVVASIRVEPLIGGVVSTSWAGLNEAASGTNPTLIPNRAGTNTGIGATDNQALDIIVNSVSRMHFSATQIEATNPLKIGVNDSLAFFVQKAGGGGPGQDIFAVDTSASGFPPGNIVRVISAHFRQETASGRNTFGTSTAFDYVFLRIAPSQVISGGASDEAHILLVEGNIQGFSGDTARINVATFTGSVTTQNVAEAVTNISQVQIDEPAITLQGSSTVTNAQSLLITGAPTEGVNNAALRVADGRIFFGGQLIVDHDSSAAFQVRKDGDAGDVLSVNTVSDIVRIDEALQVVGARGSSFGSVAPMTITSAFTINTTFTAGATGTTAHALDFFPAFTGAAGHTTALSLLSLNGTITTQTATESIANISTMVLNEPAITDNLTGLITNAQTLLITGAPTEGVDNYAFRILGGDLQIASSSAFLFRNMGDSEDLTALSVIPSESLSIGGAGSADFESVNIYSLGPINLRPTDDLRVLTDNSTAFRVRNAGNTITIFQVGQNQTRVVADNGLVVAASIANNSAETTIQSTFVDVATPSGSTATAVGLIPAGSFVWAVTVRVLSLVGGPAGFDVGDGIDVDRWGNSISSGALTTTDITDFTSGAVTTFPVATDVVLTSDGVDFTGGSVRITIHYLTIKTSII